MIYQTQTTSFKAELLEGIHDLLTDTLKLALYDDNADLSETTMTGCDLSDANLSGTDLSSADLSGVILEGASLTGSNLKNTILINANMSGADLEGAEVKGADFTGVDMTQVKNFELTKNPDKAKGLNLPAPE